MGFRGERIDLAQMIAQQEARIRQIETLLGGGTQSFIQVDEVAVSEAAPAVWGDMATIGPAITVSIGLSGRLLLLYGGRIVAEAISDGQAGGQISYEIRTEGGVLIHSPEDSNALVLRGYTVTGFSPIISRAITGDLVEGLAPGRYVVTLKYEKSISTNTTSISSRIIIGFPF